MGLTCCVWLPSRDGGNNSRHGLLSYSEEPVNSVRSKSIGKQRFAKSNAAWDTKQRKLETRASNRSKMQQQITVGYQLWRSPCKLQKAHPCDDSNQHWTWSTSLSDLLLHRKRVLFSGFPGCFFSNCSRYHIPSYYRELEELKKAGIDFVICISVNDPYTQQGWLDSLKLPQLESIGLYADPSGDLVREIGMGVQLRGHSLDGIRSRRFALILANGVVEHILVEESPEEFEKTKPENIIDVLSKNLSIDITQEEFYPHKELDNAESNKESVSLISVG